MSSIEEIDLDTINTLYQKGVSLVLEYGTNVLLALIFLLVGLKAISLLLKILTKGLKKGNVDPTLIPFARNLTAWLLRFMLLVSVASMIGVETTSFVAILGAAGLAVGLALQGTLSNFAGGVLLLLFKPYRAGDYISVQGEEGFVEKIDLFYTRIMAFDRRVITLPNGAIANGNIINHSEEKVRRVDMVFGIHYGSDLKKAKEVLTDLVKKHPKVLKEPEPIIAVTGLGDSSVDIIVRPYATWDDYWDVKWDIIEEAKLELEANGIVIPFPQRDVHLYKHDD
jgi:small conductance mechanosensitive channel